MAVEAPENAILPELGNMAVGRTGSKLDTPYMYYRQPNGWVKLAPIGAVINGIGEAAQRYTQHGWTALHEYGSTQYIEYTLEHPLEPLFMRGGAKELTLDQIRKCGWDHTPPLLPRCMTPVGSEHLTRWGIKMHGDACMAGMQPVEFPQLEKPGVKPDPCDFCGRDDLPTTAARNQHMRVMHKDELAQIRMGQEMANALLSVQTKQMISEDKYICGKCNEGFSAINKLGEHMKSHEDAPE